MKKILEKVLEELHRRIDLVKTQPDKKLSGYQFCLCNCARFCLNRIEAKQFTDYLIAEHQEKTNFYHSGTSSIIVIANTREQQICLQSDAYWPVNDTESRIEWLKQQIAKF